MSDIPDLDPEFYEHQIKMMSERYAKIFKKWKLSFSSYYDYVSSQLQNKKYWLWIFLCGFEKFIQEKGDVKEGRRIRIYKDADNRISKIIGSYFKERNYVKSL